MSTEHPKIRAIINEVHEVVTSSPMALVKTADAYLRKSYSADALQAERKRQRAKAIKENKRIARHNAAEAKLTAQRQAWGSSLWALRKLRRIKQHVPRGVESEWFKEARNSIYRESPAKTRWGEPKPMVHVPEAWKSIDASQLARFSLAWNERIVTPSQEQPRVHTPSVPIPIVPLRRMAPAARRTEAMVRLLLFLAAILPELDALGLPLRCDLLAWPWTGKDVVSGRSMAGVWAFEAEDGAEHKVQRDALRVIGEALDELSPKESPRMLVQDEAKSKTDARVDAPASSTTQSQQYFQPPYLDSFTVGAYRIDPTSKQRVEIENKNISARDLIRGNVVLAGKSSTAPQPNRNVTNKYTEPRSAPMSKAELARRIFNRDSAQPRDVQWDKYDLRQETDRKWTVSLAGLDSAMRDRIEKSKRP